MEATCEGTRTRDEDQSRYCCCCHFPVSVSVSVCVSLDTTEGGSPERGHAFRSSILSALHPRLVLCCVGIGVQHSIARLETNLGLKFSCVLNLGRRECVIVLLG